MSAAQSTEPLWRRAMASREAEKLRASAIGKSRDRARSGAKRTHNFVLALNDAEREALQRVADAAGMTPQEWCRYVVRRTDEQIAEVEEA